MAFPDRFSDIHNLKWVGIINETKEEEKKNYDQSHGIDFQARSKNKWILRDPCQARRHSDPCKPAGIE